MTCPSSLVLSQAFPDRASLELQSHVKTCLTCAATWSALAQTRAAAQELPYVKPDKGRRDAVRRRLLIAAARQPVVRPSLGRWGAWAGVAAAALCILLGSRFVFDRNHGQARTSHWRALVQSPSASSFVHERAGGDEWVRLQDGTLRIEVQPLQAGERFRVVCGDSEVEVRGTAFETTVERDHLRRVWVLHGVVEVRAQGQPAVLLSAGQHWQASGAPGPQRADIEAVPAAPDAVASPDSLKALALAPSVSAAPAAVVRAALPQSAAKAPPPGSRPRELPAIRRTPAPASNLGHSSASPAPPLTSRGVAAEALPAPPTKPALSVAELAFMDGWAAMRQGRHQAAAASFARAAEQSAGSPSSSLLEDARFWNAVAVARSGPRPLAITALREFLRHHPAAVRAGEASAILGWQLLREDRLDEAQRCFEEAEKDSHTSIRENARSGLAGVAARRQLNPTLR